jgi:tetratricopeptide (TPR) repeat protein
MSSSKMNSKGVHLVNGKSNTAETQEWEKLKEEARKFYRISQWSKAIGCYTKAIALNPTAAVLHANRALCQLHLSKFARAREDAENAIKLDPKVVRYYGTLARALQGLKLHLESAEACRAGLEVDPLDQDLLSMLLEAQKLNDATERATKQSRKNGSSDSKRKQDEKPAPPGLESFVPRFLRSPAPSHLTKADLRAILYNLELRAMRGSMAAQKYLRADDVMMDARWNVADGDDSQAVLRNFLAAKKLWDSVPAPAPFLTKLRKIAQDAFDKNPEDAPAIYVLIVTDAVWTGGGDYEPLLPMATACASLQPDEPRFHVTLGEVHVHLNDYGKAVECFDRALKIEWNPDVLFHKGRALLESDNDREATKVWVK